MRLKLSLLAGALAVLSAPALAAGKCTPCLEHYDVRAGFHQFVGAQEVSRCGGQTRVRARHVYGYVDNSDRAIFERVMTGQPGFDAAIPIGEACGKAKVARVKRELQAMTDAASDKYANLGFSIVRQAASVALNTACAEEAERVRLKLARDGYAEVRPVIESPFNLSDGSLPPPPPPP
jgi:hypothetical protein